MSAITFQDGLAAALGQKATPAAIACVEALSKEIDIFGALLQDGETKVRLPVLVSLHKGAEGAYEACPLGALVVGCLRARHPHTIHAWAHVIAPEVWKAKALGTVKGDRRAMSLYADCFLALSEWVNHWNKRQLKN